MSLIENIKQLPSTPGVYFMKDSLGGILYVGKAKNLKKRVQSYFRASANHSTKIKKLVQHVKKIDYTCTDTEFEAFLLECQLIKELKPPYNRQMKNHLSFVYIVIANKDGYYKLTTTTAPVLKDGDLAFGPYTNIKTVEKALHGMQESFKILCQNPFNKGRPCLNYNIGLCIGTCVGGAALEQFQDIIKRFIGLLNGNDTSLLEDMNTMMETAAANYDFELAAKYRDYLTAVQSLLYKEKVIEFTEKTRNVLVVEKLDSKWAKYFLIHRTDILFSNKIELDKQNEEALVKELKGKLLIYFSPLTATISPKIGRAEIDEAQIIYRYLNGNQCHFLSVSDSCLKEQNNDQLTKVLSEFLSKQLSS
jgi:excinuclease ABC subunit C